MDLRHQLNYLENVHKADRDEVNITLLKKQIFNCNYQCKIILSKITCTKNVA